MVKCRMIDIMAKTTTTNSKTKSKTVATVGRPKRDAIKTTVLMSRDGTNLWEATCSKLGISKTAALELAVRDFAAKNGVTIEDIEV